MPTLEADDALGIYATANPGNIICSPDKDMRQIPGTLFDMKETVNVEEDDGNQWHLIQTLAGDSTDGYSGVPGIGIKRAVALFEETGYNWDTCVKAFADKDLSEEIALENARLARILRCTDYDFIKKQPILWTSDANSRTYDGAGFQDS
jgi:DNA polymerase-1